MMKRMKTAALIAGILIGAFAPAIQAQAGDYVSVSSYNETFAPSAAEDGLLTVHVEGEPDGDGYLYVIRSVAGMVPVGEVTGQNLEGTELEPVTFGSVEFYRIQVADKEKPAVFTAQFSCPGFYSSKKTAEENGGEDFAVSYKFTNYFPEKIGKYTLKIELSQGNQVVRVTKPAAYADFILSEENGMRAVGLSKGIAPSGTVNLDFTYDVPATSGMAGKAVIWVICLVPGLAVMVDRLKKTREEQQ